MERRKDKRHPANVRTKILYKGRTYSGVIENLSASGAGALTEPLKNENEVEFCQYDPIKLTFKSTSGEKFTIKCTIMWANYIPPQNVRCRIGLELVGRPWDAISQFIK